MDDVVEIVQSWAAQIDQLFQTMGFWNMMTHLLELYSKWADLFVVPRTEMISRMTLSPKLYF